MMPPANADPAAVSVPPAKKTPVLSAVPPMLPIMNGAEIANATNATIATICSGLEPPLPPAGMMRAVTASPGRSTMASAAGTSRARPLCTIARSNPSSSTKSRRSSRSPIPMPGATGSHSTRTSAGLHTSKAVVRRRGLPCAGHAQSCTVVFCSSSTFHILR